MHIFSPCIFLRTRWSLLTILAELVQLTRYLSHPVFFPGHLWKYSVPNQCHPIRIGGSNFRISWMRILFILSEVYIMCLPFSFHMKLIFLPCLEFIHKCWPTVHVHCFDIIFLRMSFNGVWSSLSVKHIRCSAFFLCFNMGELTIKNEKWCRGRG